MTETTDLQLRLLKARIAAAAASKPAVVPNPDWRNAQPPEGMVMNPATGQMTSRELMANNMQPSALDAVAGGATQGYMFGGSDELMGAIGALDGSGYDFRREQARAMLDAVQRDYPKTALGSEIAGAVFSPTGKLGIAASGASVPVKMAAGAASGAAQGGLYGFLAGEGGQQNRATQGLESAAVGGMLGGAIPALFGLGAKAVNAVKNSGANKAFVKAAPTIDDLAAAASAAFGRADNVTNLPRAGLTGPAQDMIDTAQRSGMDSVLTPQAYRAADRIAEEATSADPNISFRALDILRRQAQVPAGNMSSPIEAKIGTGMVNGLDDVIDTIDPGLGADVADARKLWGQMRRAETLGLAGEKATNQASGEENGIRIYLRQILNNPAKQRGFSPDELAMMKQIVQGTVGANILKKLSKFGPGSGGQSNMLGASIGGGTGAALGSAFGPAGAAVGSMAVPAMGYAAGKLAEGMSKKKLDLLTAMVLSGSKPGAQQGMTPLQEQILQSLFGPAVSGVNPLTALLNKPELQAR